MSGDNTYVVHAVANQDPALRMDVGKDGRESAEGALVMT